MDERDFRLSLYLAWPDPRVEETPPQGACNEQPAQQARDAILCPPAEWFALGLTVGLPSPAAEPPNAVPAVSSAAINTSSASKSPATHTTANLEQTPGVHPNKSERSPEEQQTVSKDENDFAAPPDLQHKEVNLAPKAPAAGSSKPPR